jgi:hypothetical protein
MSGMFAATSSAGDRPIRARRSRRAGLAAVGDIVVAEDAALFGHRNGWHPAGRHLAVCAGETDRAAARELFPTGRRFFARARRRSVGARLPPLRGADATVGRLGEGNPDRLAPKRRGGQGVDPDGSVSRSPTRCRSPRLQSPPDACRPRDRDGLRAFPENAQHHVGHRPSAKHKGRRNEG